MQFYYNQFLAKHWNQLVTMLEDNYQTPENMDDTVIMGLHCHNSMKHIKQQVTDRKLILYQTEPLIDGAHWHPIDKIISNIEGADEVWDYDLENIEILRSYGIEAKFCPPAFSHRLKRINNIDNPDIDVLFYGSHSTHRYELLRDMNATMINNERTTDFLMNGNIVWLYNITDDLLDHFIARSKIILNLKPFDHTVRQQQTRIYYPLINDKCILSERCNINYFGDTIHEFTGLEELKEKIIYLLENDNWRNIKQNHAGWIGAKDKSKTAVFYHLNQKDNWEIPFYEKIQKLQATKVYDTADYIHIGINGKKQLPISLDKINRVKYNSNLNSENENDTLLDVYNFSKVNPDYKILYLSENATDFWWTNSNYISTLNPSRLNEILFEIE